MVSTYGPSRATALRTNTLHDKRTKTSPHTINSAARCNSSKATSERGAVAGAATRVGFATHPVLRCRRCPRSMIYQEDHPPTRPLLRLQPRRADNTQGPSVRYRDSKRMMIFTPMDPPAPLAFVTLLFRRTFTDENTRQLYRGVPHSNAHLARTPQCPARHLRLGRGHVSARESRRAADGLSLIHI